MVELVRSVGKTAPATLADQDVIAIPVGKGLKIETFPDGVEILRAEAPEGKEWTQVTITVHVVETDAA